METPRPPPTVGRMTATLSALDETFLELEDGDPGAHMHLGAILVLDRPPDEPRSAEAIAARMRELVRARVLGLPRLSQRLSSPTGDGWSRPHWVQDERFALDRHLRRAALPTPGDRGALEAWCGEFFGQRLDRRHPLWEIVVVEGLADGRWALATKLHHCLADGIGSLGIAEALLGPIDGSGLSGGGPLPLPPPRRSVLGQIASGPLALASAGLQTLRYPRRIRDAIPSALAGAELVAGELAHRPLAALDVPLGPQRRFTTLTAPLRELRAIEHGLGGTINDAVLAIVAGALRRLVQARREPLPERGVRAMVPVDRRDDAAPPASGNRISALFVDLPVAIDTAGARHAAVHAAAAARKHAGQANGGSAVLRLAELVPPALHRPLARLFVTPRLFDLTVTNVAGPQRTIEVIDSPVREIHPLVPLAPDHALGVAVISHADAMTFGVVADFDAVPDIDEFRSGLHDELGELRRLATRRTPSAADAGVTPLIP